jgi:hypothetical protein
MRAIVLNSILFFSSVCLLLPLTLLAQPPRLELAVSRNHILIGDTLTLKIRSEYNRSLRQELSNLGDTLGIFEILNRSQPVVVSNNDRQQFAQDLTLIAFDAGSVEIPTFDIAYINQESGATNSIATQPIAIQIDSIAVDMQQDIKPIVPPIDVPLTWRDYLPYILLLLAILAAIFAFIWYRRRPKKAIAAPTMPEAPPQPAFEIALTQLKALAQAQYWQQGNTKRYYSELSDIMRQYISARYGIKATEQITDEIIEQLHLIGEYSPPTMANIAEKSPLATANNNSLDPAATTVAEPVRLEKKLSPQQIQAIDHLLKTADMVKFAKAQPDISTHQQLWHTAEQWVKNTQ